MDVDLKLTTKRKMQNTRQKRVGAPLVGRRSRPDTPLLKWKTEEREKGGGVEAELEEEEDGGRRAGTRGRRKRVAAVMWRFHLPETVTPVEYTRERLGFKPGDEFMDVPFLHHHKDKIYSSVTKDTLPSPSSVPGTKNSLLRKIEHSIPFSNSAIEGATKWDPVGLKATDDALKLYCHGKCIDQQVSAVSIVSALEAELEQARSRIEELETEQQSSKKNLEQFLRKVSEERGAWRSREHEKIRAFVDDIKAELSRKKKNRQRLEIVNSKLVNELAATKSSAKQYVQDFEKERKARELIEEVCDELAKEIREDKAEVEALRRDSMKHREEVDEERKMLQMAEVWREERVQMKLIDAKVALEERYSQMNKLVADLETFLRFRTGTLDAKDMREEEAIRQAAASVTVKDIKEFTYEPSNPDDIFAVFGDIALAEASEREIELRVAHSPANYASKVDMKDETEEEESGWETVSHVDDECSSCSSASVNKNCGASTFSDSGIDWEENACGDSSVTETSEVCSLPARESKKVSVARLWRSDRGSGLWGKWGSPDITRGMKGCMEWPRGPPKGSLKAKLVEARMETEKVQLRHILKQKT
ncbi:hypothetical protein F3Y22_tig00002077pilonHSYRG00006 [Hibiscus syriacus]|uniref:Uncharacterized protein n=1 Tax=Hibiscus syriacus TaxID=106335 RepID=A0A6A3CV92_HIBSY|nr:hypothetical protein F3Y22_tig00002077pilonHSYRG00006 [Hibiscus syriacus]